jgi:hypothetical protein
MAPLDLCDCECDCDCACGHGCSTYLAICHGPKPNQRDYRNCARFNMVFLPSPTTPRRGQLGWETLSRMVGVADLALTSLLVFPASH